MFNGKPLIIEAIDTTFDNPGNPLYNINEFIEQKYELMSDITGTGFPKIFYLRYHMYRSYFPLLALSKYRNMVGSSK